MKKHTDDSTQNARIHINYKTGGVVFGYPNGKKHAGLWERWLSLFLTSMNFVILFMFFFMILLMFGLPLGDKISTNFFLYIAFFAPGVLVIPLALDKKKFGEIYPKISIWVARTTPFYGEVCVYEINEVRGKTFELPFFENKVLRYKATDDFSKYLERVDVVERPFIVERTCMKPKKNEMIWKAIFRFTETPIIGSLRIEFI